MDTFVVYTPRIDARSHAVLDLFSLHVSTSISCILSSVQSDWWIGIHECYTDSRQRRRRVIVLHSGIGRCFNLVGRYITQGRIQDCAKGAEYAQEQCTCSMQRLGGLVAFKGGH